MKTAYSAFFLLLLVAIPFNLPAKETDPLFNSARQAIEEKDFDTAIRKLEQAIKSDPQNSEYYRWLGRAYGLQAEQATWFRAISLAKKARINFEKAVELDPENIGALLDLREFYSQAPSFLGGGQKKADKITEKLKALGYDDEQQV